MSNNNRERAAGAIAGAVQAAIETMETRRLLSTVQVVDGVLLIDADPHTASNIIVDLHAPKGRIRGYCAGVAATFASAEIKAIRINGSDGDDNVFIDSDIALPTLIRTGAGDDRVRGGSGVDTVDAGAGDDTLIGARGNDRLSGGAGDDIINGNLGDDVIDGGAGDDRLSGQDGDDTIYGGEGFDLLAGQGGNDKIYGGAGDDRVLGSLGEDQLFGGPGNDILEGHSGNDQLVGGLGSDTLRGGTGKNSLSSDGTNGRDPDPDLTQAPNIENPKPGDGGDPTPPPSVPGNGGGDNSGDDGTPQPVVKAPRPVIHMIGDADRMVGSAVHVHGLESDLNGGTVIHGRFEWDFGDPSGRYNKLNGFNAAHVYDKPGVYTVTLTVTNEAGGKAAATVTVNVAAENRRTVYVDSANGDDGNNGSSPDRAVLTPQRAFDLAGDNTRVLFKSGQKFTIDRTLIIDQDHVLVGAYGTGALPLLYRVEGEGDGVFRTTDAADDVTIEDLRIDSQYKASADGAAPKIPVTGVYAGGSNITVRDIEFVNVGNGVNANQKPTGLLVQDTEVTKPYGMRSYHVWGEGTDLVILGNVSQDSSREHNVRFSGAERILIAYNHFAQTDRSDVDPADIQKGCIEIHRGQFAYITDNVVHGGPIRTGPRGGGYEPPETETAWVVIENNRCDDTGVQLYAGSHHIMVRNNVIEQHDSMHRGPAITLMAPDRDNRMNDDVYILNNTAVEQRSSGAFLKLYGAAVPAGVTVKNNLWVNDGFRAGYNGSSGVYVSEDDLASFKEISGNVWATPQSATDWAQGGGSNYVGADWGQKGAYKTVEQWNSYAQVGTDYFTNDVVIKDVYQVALDGTTAGSTLKVAA